MDPYGNAKKFSSFSMQNLFNQSKPIGGISWAANGNLHLPKTPHIPNATIPFAHDGGMHNSVVGMQSYADDENIYGLVEEKPPKPERRGRKKKRIDPDGQDPAVNNEDASDSRLKNYESAAARKRNVTAEERERAIRAAKAFEPVNPFCRVVLRPSYLYKGCIMYLPSCFAEKHLNGVSGFIKLQYFDKQWPVRCIYGGGRAKFRKGWYEFTLENNIGEGDVCVFELLNSRDIVLRVTVFRVTEHGGFMNRP